MKNIYKTLKQFVMAAAVVGVVTAAPQLQAKEKPYRTEKWYGTVALSKVIDTDGSGFRANLGSTTVPVLADGNIDYDGNFAGALAVGFENSICRKNNTPVYLRTEGELFLGSADRNSVTVGVKHALLDDTVNVRALFANALLGM